jgi:hypothetical protein
MNKSLKHLKVSIICTWILNSILFIFGLFGILMIPFLFDSPENELNLFVWLIAFLIGLIPMLTLFSSITSLKNYKTNNYIKALKFNIIPSCYLMFVYILFSLKDFL